MNEPSVINWNLLAIRVCVPAWWEDEQVIAFAEREDPCGTTGGWHIRREGDPMAQGDPERARCGEREGWVHIVLVA